MEIDRTAITEIAHKLCQADEVKTSEIPELELYMDQLLTFLNNKLAQFKRDHSDKLLTKTMINNYTKDQLLFPPKNKKYSQEHVMLLLLIYHLKNVLSIDDIKHLFRPILKDINTPDDDLLSLAEIYSSFVELRLEQYEDFSQSFTKEIEYIRQKTVNIENEENRPVAETFLIVLILVAHANASKRLAEKIIDLYFKKTPE